MADKKDKEISLSMIKGLKKDEKKENKPKELPEDFPKNPPRDLPTKGKTLWRRLVYELNEAEMLLNIDRTGLEELCNCYGIMKDLEDQIKDEGWSVPDERGSVKKNPLFSEMRFYREQFLKLCKAYNIFPKYRKGSKLENYQDKNKNDEINKILSGDI